MTAQHFEFSSRLSRIDAGQGSFKKTLFVGPDDSYVVTYKTRGGQPQGGFANRLGYLTTPVMMAACFVIGMLGNLTARLADFYIGIPAAIAEDPDLLMAALFAASTAMALCLCVALSLSVRRYIGAVIAGVITGMIALHNLVHVYPTEIATYLPQDWVSSVLASTQPQSLVLRDASILF